LENISELDKARAMSDGLAQELLRHSLDGTPWPEELLDHLLEGERSISLLRIVVERLADLFEPGLIHVYAELMSEAISRIIPTLHAPHLVERYQRVSKPRKLDRDPASIANVFVLSRVTLGADVAITSVILDAAKKAFPHSAIYYVGPIKGWELFAADARVQCVPIAYGRSGTLQDRLSIWPALSETVSRPNSIVIDPDSRLTQLGLLPICGEEDYYFFESRSYGGDRADSLTALTQQWVAETFGARDARPYIRTGREAEPFMTTVSFGVGENPAKRTGDAFEREVLKILPQPISIDKGAGDEEADRVERAVADSGVPVRFWEGSFAGFAEHIARSKLYVGYDSAGGHVAAACGVPLISIFTGFASERMFQRWRPTGAGPILVIRPDNVSSQEILNQIGVHLRSAAI
jgi:hypothetical protein